jgi:hypothetical protein
MARCAIVLFMINGCLIATARPSAAQQWLLQPTMQQQLKYNDNVLLSPGNEKSGIASVSTPEVKISRLDDRLNLSLDGQFRFTRYFDRPEFDSDDQFLRFDGSYLASERSTLRLLTNFSRDTSLTSDLIDSGTFLTKLIRVTSVNVLPSWQYLLSERDTLTLAGGFNQVDYGTSSEIDYRNYTASTTYNHQFTELFDINAAIDYQRFEPLQGSTAITDTAGFLLGVDYHPTERLNIGGAAGVNYAIAESSNGGNGGNGDNQVGYRLKFNANYMLNDQTHLTAVFSHDREPSSNGELVNRNRARVGISYQLNPLLTLSFAGSYYNNTDPLSSTSSSTNKDTQSYILGPTVAWQFSESWNLAGSYTYRHKISGQGHESATSNAVFVTLRYSPLGFQWSE